MLKLSFIKAKQAFGLKGLMLKYQTHRHAAGDISPLSRNVISELEQTAAGVWSREQATGLWAGTAQFTRPESISGSLETTDSCQ